MSDEPTQEEWEYIGPDAREVLALNRRIAALDVDHKAACPRPAPTYRTVGTRRDGASAGVLECHVCHAGRPLAIRDYELIAVDVELQSRGDAAQAPPSPNYNGLSREDILQAKRNHDGDGHTSAATHRRLGMSKTSLVRARHALGLVPWPKNGTGGTGSDGLTDTG